MKAGEVSAKASKLPRGREPESLQAQEKMRFLGNELDNALKEDGGGVPNVAKVLNERVFFAIQMGL